MKKIFFVMAGLMLGGVQTGKALAAEVHEAEPVVVTATRIAQHNYRITGNVTVIDQDDIKALGAQNIPELLSDAIGVNIYNYGTAKSSNIDIRGFGETAPSNVLVLVNDRKINSVDLSGPDLLRIPIGAIDRIEIIRGAGSVLYGDNAVGGVVNIITKKGKGELTGKTSGSYGSFDTVKTDIEASGSKNNFNYFVYANYFDTEGYRDNSDVLSKDGNTRLGYDITDLINMDVSFFRHEDKYGLPSSLSTASLATLGRKASTAPNDFATTDDQSVNLTVDFAPLIKDEYFGHVVLDLLYRDRDVLDSFAGFGDTRRSIITRGIAGKYIFDRTVFDREVNFVTGIDYYDNENDLVGENGSTTDATISKEEIGGYGFAEYEMIPKVFVNAGTRYHKAVYDFNDRANAATVEQKPDEWVSMGGMKYEYTEGSNAFFNVQQTFRYLATDEWFSTFTGILNTALDQQTGLQYEGGIKHDFKNGIVSSITPYRMDITNEIFFDPRTFTNSNYDKTRRVGVEIGADADILKFAELNGFDKLSLSMTYSFQDPQFRKGNNKEKDIPLAPRHQANFRLHSQFLEYYNVSLGGRYVGSRFQISDIGNVAAPLKPYYVFDIKFAYERKNMELFTAVNNLFDEQYFGTAVFVAGFGSFYYPSPGRSYITGAKFKF